jgi:hypothetical protein
MIKIKMLSMELYQKRRRGTARLIVLLIMFISTFFQFCSKYWEDHYDIREISVNKNMWEDISNEPRYSLFVNYMLKYKLDSLIRDSKPLTLFIPPDETLAAVQDTGNVIRKLLEYHISPFVFLIRNVNGQKQLLTQSKKYAMIRSSQHGHNYDEVQVTMESPLYLNGKYYELAEPATPKPNLYEVTEIYSQVIKEFIDLQDSVYLDLKASKPIGFDESGNTVYDSVTATVNLFEKYYFPVKEEFRTRAATMILFTQEQYISALDEMASRLGGSFFTHEDIPVSWQFDVLLPEMMEKGLFDNRLNYVDLMVDTLKSVTGDSVVIDHTNIDPLSIMECSNGVAYNYSNFSVPLDLYLNTIRVEGENLVDSIGAGRFAWKEEVTVTGTAVEPVRQTTLTESLVSVDLGRNFSGQYSVQFRFKDVWPARYRLLWRANYRPSGLFAVYINEDKVGEFDTYSLRSTVISVTGTRFSSSSSGFNRKDFWVENIDEFGDVAIRFEYLGTGFSSTNGFNIDYVELIPVIE